MKNLPPIILYGAATLGVGLVSGLMGVIFTPDAPPPPPPPPTAAELAAEKARLHPPALAAMPAEVAQHKNPEFTDDGSSFSSGDYHGRLERFKEGHATQYIVEVNGVEHFNAPAPNAELQALLAHYPTVKPALQNAPQGYRLVLWSDSAKVPDVETLHATLARKDDPAAVQWGLERLSKLPHNVAVEFTPDVIALADVYHPMPLGGLAAVKRIGVSAIPAYQEALKTASPVQATNIAQFILALGNPAVPHILDIIDSCEGNAYFLNAMSRYFLLENRQFSALNRQRIKERLNLVPMPELPDDIAYALNASPTFSAIELKKLNDGLAASDWPARAEAITFGANATPRLSLAQKEQVAALLTSHYAEDLAEADAAQKQEVLVTYHNAFSRIGVLPDELLAQFRTDITSEDALRKGLSAAQLLLYELSEDYRTAFFESLSESAQIGAHIPQLVKSSPRVVGYLVPELVKRYAKAEELQQQAVLLAVSDILLRRDAQDAILAGQAGGATAESQRFGRVPTARERALVQRALRPLQPELKKALKHGNDDVRVLAATVAYRIDKSDEDAGVILRACARSAPLEGKKAYCTSVLKDQEVSS